MCDSCIFLKILSCLENPQDEPTDLINLMLTHKSMRDLINALYILKPTFLDGSHLLSVCMNFGKFLQKYITEYQNDIGILTKNQSEILQIDIKLYSRKVSDITLYMIKITRTNGEWQSQLGIDGNWWYVDVINYFEKNHVNVKNLAVREVNVGHTNIYLEDIKDGLSVYILMVAAYIFPSTLNHQSYQKVLEKYVKVVATTKKSDYLNVFKKRTHEIPDLAKEFIMANNMKKINLK